MIENGNQSKIDEEWCKKELGLDDIYCGGAHDLKIEWIPEGVKFSINEYDGSESLYLSDKLDYTA
jgi:hypothetical protein